MTPQPCEWKEEKSRNTDYYFDTTDGRIIGQVTNMVNTSIWVGKVIFNHNEEKFLGQYISKEHCKQAVVRYWDMQNQTLIEGVSYE